MENNNNKLKVQLITEGKWPYVGNAFRNRDGSVSLYLDEGVTLSGGQKLRAAREKAKPSEAAAAATE